jgi:hypothetical protein
VLGPAWPPPGLPANLFLAPEASIMNKNTCSIHSQILPIKKTTFLLSNIKGILLFKKSLLFANAYTPKILQK